MHLPVPSSRAIEQAVAVFQRGGVVAFPTDTGYAMGCDLLNKKAVDKVLSAKQRDPKKPLSFICADLKELSQFAVVSDRAYRDMRRLLPGPYTFVLPATKRVPKLLISRRSSVGIRVPDHAVTKALVMALRHPVIGTSCATPDGQPLLSAADIQKAFGKRVDLILDCGPVASEPSTVIDFTTPEPVILRVGKGDISVFGKTIAIQSENSSG